ncbi:MAG: hypothetical protein ACR2M1_05210 [Gemmatimonadaceae bacterium]
MALASHSPHAVVLGTNAEGRVVIVRESTTSQTGPLYLYFIARDNGTRYAVTRVMAIRILRDGGARRFMPPVALGTDCDTCSAVGTVEIPAGRYTGTSAREVMCQSA